MNVPKKTFEYRLPKNSQGGILTKRMNVLLYFLKTTLFRKSLLWMVIGQFPVAKLKHASGN